MSAGQPSSEWRHEFHGKVSGVTKAPRHVGHALRGGAEFTAHHEDAAVTGNDIGEAGDYLWKIPKSKSAIPELRFFMVTHKSFPGRGDVARLTWWDSDIRDDKPRHIELEEVSKVVLGHATKAFQQQQHKGEKLPAEHLSFSLVAGKRTVDLGAESLEDLIAWLKALRPYIPRFDQHQAVERLIREAEGLHDYTLDSTTHAPGSNPAPLGIAEAACVFAHARANAPHSVRSLIVRGCNPNLAETDTGNTALHCAAEYGHAKVVKMLVEMGVDRTVRNLRGLTAAELARLSGQIHIAEIIETGDTSLPSHSPTRSPIRSPNRSPVRGSFESDTRFDTPTNARTDRSDHIPMSAILNHGNAEMAHGSLAGDELEENVDTRNATVNQGFSPASDWTLQYTEAGDAYYYNHVTGESQWEAPAGFEHEPHTGQYDYDSTAAYSDQYAYDAAAGYDSTHYDQQTEHDSYSAETYHESHGDDSYYSHTARTAFGADSATTDSPIGQLRHPGAAAAAAAQQHQQHDSKPMPQPQPQSDDDDGDYDIEYEDLEDVDPAAGGMEEGRDDGEHFYGADELGAYTDDFDNDDSAFGDEDGFFEFDGDDSNLLANLSIATGRSVEDGHSGGDADDNDAETTGEPGTPGQGVQDENVAEDDDSARRKLLQSKMQEEERLLAELEAKRKKLQMQMEVCANLFHRVPHSIP